MVLDFETSGHKLNFLHQTNPTFNVDKSAVSCEWRAVKTLRKSFAMEWDWDILSSGDKSWREWVFITIKWFTKPDKIKDGFIELNALRLGIRLEIMCIANGPFNKSEIQVIVGTRCHTMEWFPLNEHGFYIKPRNQTQNWP